MYKGCQQEAKGLNIREAARYCGVSTPTFRRHIMPQLQHRAAGTRKLFSRDTLDRWLEGSSSR